MNKFKASEWQYTLLIHNLYFTFKPRNGSLVWQMEGGGESKTAEECEKNLKGQKERLSLKEKENYEKESITEWKWQRMLTIRKEKEEAATYWRKNKLWEN